MNQFDQNMDFQTWQANNQNMRQGTQDQIGLLNTLLGWQGLGVNAANNVSRTRRSTTGSSSPKAPGNPGGVGGTIDQTTQQPNATGQSALGSAAINFGTLFSVGASKWHSHNNSIRHCFSNFLLGRWAVSPPGRLAAGRIQANLAAIRRLFSSGSMTCHSQTTHGVYDAQGNLQDTRSKESSSAQLGGFLAGAAAMYGAGSLLNGGMLGSVAPLRCSLRSPAQPTRLWIAPRRSMILRRRSTSLRCWWRLVLVPLHGEALWRCG